MASKREIALLLAQQKKGGGGKKEESSSSAPKAVLKVKPIRTVPPGPKRLKISEVEVPASDPPVVDLTRDRGKGIASGDPEPAAEVAGHYPSPTFSGTGMGLPVPASIDARLMDDDKASYLKTFPPALLFKQMKGMAVFTASVLKFFETGSSWDESINLEKERLQKLAEGKVAAIQASFDQDKEALRKAKEEADGRAAEEGRLKIEAEGKVASLTEQLTGVQEEARVAREKAAKAEEELAAKVEALRVADEKVATLEEANMKFGQAATATWLNAQEQVHLLHPGLDLSYMVMDGFVEEGDLWCFNEEGVIVKVELPGSGSS